MRNVHYNTPRILQTLVWIPTRIVLTALTGFEIKGKENLKKMLGPVIFASNHESEMDVIFIPAALTPFSPLFPIFYVARNKGKYNLGQTKGAIYGGKLFDIWGAYPIISGFKNYDTSLQVHATILKKGKSLHIFPEGKMSENGIMADKARGGVAYLSWKMKAPIVPVRIRGTHKTTIKDFIKGKKKYSITFGKPLYPIEFFDKNKNPSVEEFQAVAQEILDEIKKL